MRVGRSLRKRIAAALGRNPFRLRTSIPISSMPTVHVTEIDDDAMEDLLGKLEKAQADSLRTPERTVPEWVTRPLIDLWSSELSACQRWKQAATLRRETILRRLQEVVGDVAVPGVGCEPEVLTVVEVLLDELEKRGGARD